MNLDKWHKIVRVILIAIPVVFFVFLLSRDLVVSGRLEASYNFDDQSPYIMPLAPKARVSEIEIESSYHYQSLFDDPIYFDIRLPRSFRQMTLWLTYRPQAASEPVKLAIFINKDKWEFEAKDFSQVENLDNGWQRGEVTFDLTGKRFAFQKYQAMISLPQIKGSGRVVDVREIELVAEREPLTVDRVVRKVGSWL